MTKFLNLKSPLLRKISQDIPSKDINSTKTRNLICKMFEIAKGEQKDHEKPVMVGLAAPQIGIFKRIILTDTKADGKGKIGNLKVYINPQIIWKSKRVKRWYEGCFSTGEICGIVSRPISIKIKAYTYTCLPKLKETEDNDISKDKVKVVEERWTGYIARIFQHEIDHLNGVLFFDHIKDPKKLHLVKKEEFNTYRKGAWKTWHNKYP